MSEEFENFHPIENMHWQWSVKDLPNKWEEKDLVDGEGWEITGFNKGAEAIPLSGFLMRFHKEVESSYNPQRDQKIFMCVQREDDQLKNSLVIIVQDDKQYIIDMLEMDRRIAQEESTILDN